MRSSNQQAISHLIIQTTGLSCTYNNSNNLKQLYVNLAHCTTKDQKNLDKESEQLCIILV